MNSKSKNLSHHLGGNWVYDGRSSWWCDDKIRHVSRCCPGIDEFDNVTDPPEYWLYGNKIPQRAELFLLSPKNFKNNYNFYVII